MELLTGSALTWAMAVWEQGSEPISSYECFTELCQRVFDHLAESREMGEQLLTITQGTCRVADHALEFRTIAAGSGWNNTMLKAAFRPGSNPEVLSMAR